MLDDYKKMYRDNADCIPNWRKMSRNELCNLYLKYKEENNPLYENCLSAIIYKFWNVATHNYYTQRYKFATPEDCYDWLITGIMYVLDHHVWTDPESNLYGDENAPEKAINVKVYSEKINFYVAIQRQKRKTTLGIYSLDKMEDDLNSDDYVVPIRDNYNISDDFLSNIIKNEFNNKNYFGAFILDAVLNENLLDKIDIDGVLYTKFNRKRLKKYLKHLGNKSCALFAYQYDIPVEKVLDAATYVNNKSSIDLDKKIEDFFFALKKKPEYKELMNFISTYEENEN